MCSHRTDCFPEWLVDFELSGGVVSFFLSFMTICESAGLFGRLHRQTLELSQLNADGYLPSCL